jgi:circadian clock protein KaiC
MTHATPARAQRELASTGVEGLDVVLGGGLPSGRLYLLEGSPGTGKTTLSLQFLLDGALRGERGLYVTLSETAEELRASAETHGWSLDQLDIHELVSELGLDPDSEQTILHPSDLELGEIIREVMQRVDDLKPVRVVFDSLSELRLLSQSALRYRRQILALKQFFSTKGCTVLLLDDRTSGPTDLQLHSIAHGVISLEQTQRSFGAERRWLRVAKLRGVKFNGGHHDFILDTGGLTVFPRLVAAHHHATFDPVPASTGSDGLDRLLGGGLVPGTNTLLSGPAGIGKTTTAVQCMISALKRGTKATYFLFDEGMATFLTRAAVLGMDLKPFLADATLTIMQVDPAELAPGEFACRVREAVEHHGSSLVVIDSLNAYLHSMPEEQHLILQMHELLSYLNQLGVTTLLVLGQHGLLGDVRSDVDLSYLSDGILLFRYFEAQGQVRTAVSVVKSRVSAHERSIRELKVTTSGILVGDSLVDFEGVLTGLPTYRGLIPMIEQGPVGSSPA